MSDSTLYLYTSLIGPTPHTTASLSHTLTILASNNIPCKLVDLTTDPAAREVWDRYSWEKRLPALVKSGSVICDQDEIADWDRRGKLVSKVHGIEAAGRTPTAIDTAYPDTAAAIYNAPPRDTLPAPRDPGFQNSFPRARSVPNNLSRMTERPSLQGRDDVAVQSSENFRADNGDYLGLISHHRGSVITAIPDEERRRISQELWRLGSSSSAEDMD